MRRLESIQSGRECARAQKGVTLVLVLLLLLLVTLLGLAALRGSILQERMSGNVAARAIAFQNAEAVLREAEAFAVTRPTMPAASAGCANGLCGIPAAGVAAPWEATGFWDVAANYRTSTQQATDTVMRYVIEDMGLGTDTTDDCTTLVDTSASPCSSTVQRYRITVLSRLSNGAEVVLQSRYQVQ